MIDSNRREFLQTTGAALTAGWLATRAANADEPVADIKPPGSNASDIPPHKPLDLVGIHAYADRVSVAPGETIHFHVSSTLPYELQVCRLGTDVDRPESDQVLRTWKVENPEGQPIHPGSYIEIEKGLDAPETAELTLEIWVRLWDIPGRQAIFAQGDADPGAETGFGLFVDREGRLGFLIADDATPPAERLHWTQTGHLTRSETTPAAVPTPTQVAHGGRGLTWAPWRHVVVTFAKGVKRVWLDSRRVAEFRTSAKGFSSDKHSSNGAPLKIGACRISGLADLFLDADIARPTIYGRALTEAEIRRNFEAIGANPPSKDKLLGFWPLDEERGDRVADASGNERHGRIVNSGTWMIGGPTFHADLPRFADYDPATDPKRGHGLRLASDDLYDCRWRETFAWRVPDDAKSGVYAARFHVRIDDDPRLYHCLFITRKAPTAKKAPVAFLCSTNSWRAYSGTPFCETWTGTKQSIGHAYVNSPGDPPAFSCYWQHRAGQGGYQMGTRMPWPVAGPYTFHQDLNWECSHLCHADRLSLSWLEREGYEFDVFADFDLHREPELLSGYKTLFVVGHSEYWSAEAYEGVVRYFEGGGTMVCLSGNTMFWRVSFDPEGRVMECRKVDAPGAQMHPWMRGEVWHSHDFKKGGMSRECGYPAWRAIGLEYMSVHAVGVPGVGPYRVSDADHFLFRKPHQLGLSVGDPLGSAPNGGLPELIGHEGDVRVSTLAKVMLQPPLPGGTAPTEDPAGITLLAEGIVEWDKVSEGAPYDYYQRAAVAPPERVATGVSGEMIYWERPDGGRVFHAGSVSAGRGFRNDPKFGLLIQNVLAHFGVPPPA